MPVDRLTDAECAHIRETLLAGYDEAARILPWRVAPGSAARPDPYRVWLSEIMLQQTTVGAVAPYFERFTSRWSTLADLAAAPEEEVLAAWAGLGYYSRARNLVACARTVTQRHEGRFPADMTQLRALPGIGDYTAAAIAAIAFGADAIPIDAHVGRVIARLFAIDRPVARARDAIIAAARRIWPASRGGDMAQALMDFGTRICTARAPRCESCPIARQCLAHRLGRQDALPVRPAKAAKAVRHARASWIERDGQVWLVRRPPRGLLGGMRALPDTPWLADSVAPPAGAVPLGAVEHIFTHIRLHLAVDRVDASGALYQGAGDWWPVARLDEAGLPTLYRRAATLALAQDQRAGEP